MSSVKPEESGLLRDFLTFARERHPEWSLHRILCLVSSLAFCDVRNLALEIGFRDAGEPTASVIDDNPFNPNRFVPLQFDLQKNSRRHVSDGERLVRRQVTSVGQFSYRGQAYSLGCLYRKQRVLLRESDSELIVILANGAHLRLAIRAPRAHKSVGTIHASSL